MLWEYHLGVMGAPFVMYGRYHGCVMEVPFGGAMSDSADGEDMFVSSTCLSVEASILWIIRNMC